MTDINVITTSVQTDRRGWYLGTADTPGLTINARIDVSAFTAATHYPDGFIPSGTAVAKIDAASTADLTVVGPYDNAAVDGRQTCLGLLFSSEKVPSVADTTKDTAGAVLVAFAGVRLSKLPRPLDANGQGDLTHLYLVA